MRWKRWLVGKVAAALVASVVLVVLVDLLAVLLSPAVWVLNRPLRAGPEVRRHAWEQLHLNPPASYRRSLTMEVEDDHLTALYVLTVQADDELLRLVQAGQADDHPDRFAAYAFGSVTVAQVPEWLPESVPRRGIELDFEAPVVMAQPASGTAELHMKSRSFDLLMPRFRIVVAEPTLSASSDELTVTGQQLVVRSRKGEWPQWQLGSMANFARRPGGEEVTFDVERRNLSTVQSRLMTLGTVSIPVVGDFLLLVMGQVPMVVLLYFLARVYVPRKGGRWVGVLEAADWRRTTALLTIWPLGLAVVNVAIELDWRAGHYLEPLTSWLLEPGEIPDLTGGYGLGMVAALVLWPVAVMRQLRGQGDPGSDRRLHRMLCALLLAAAIAGVLAVLELGGQLPVSTRPVELAVACVLTVLGIFLASLVLGRAMLGGRRSGSVAATATVVLVLVASLFHALLYSDSERVNVFAVAAFLLLASTFTLTFALLAWKVVQTALRRRSRDRPRYQGSDQLRQRLSRRAVFGLLILLVLLPSVGLVIPLQQAARVGPWSVFPFGYALLWLSGWLGMVYLLFVLQSLSEGPVVSIAAADRRRELVRATGIVFVVFTFYWPDQNWLYIPVTIILGALLAAKLLLPKERLEELTAVETAISDAVEQPESRYRSLRELLRDAVEISRAEDALRAVRAGAAKEVSNGATDVQPTRDPSASGDGETEPDPVRIWERRLQRHEQDFPVKVNGKSAKQIALGLTPGLSPWRNGWHGTRWGLVIGMPWSLLALWDLATGPGTLGDVTLLDYLGEASWLLLQWAVFGFFFGYYYPYIRGDNGIEKGICLFLTIVAPPAIFNIMTVPRSLWSGFFLWALQVLLFSLLLGVFAGDLANLWRVKLGWPQLVQLHNVRYLVTFASSLAVAGGAAVATWISTGATLLTTLMETVGGPAGTPPAGSP